MEEVINNTLAGATYKTPTFNLNGMECDAKCVKVYDGDTATFVFEPFAGVGLFKFSCRMLGYNSAEMRSKSAAEVASAYKSQIALSEKIMNKVVRLQVGKFDKYGRPLVIVYADGLNLNEWMIANKYGEPYTGAGEKKW